MGRLAEAEGRAEIVVRRLRHDLIKAFDNMWLADDRIIVRLIVQWL
jgi:hypothetical protein